MAEVDESKFTMPMIMPREMVLALRITDRVHKENASGYHKNGFCAACAEVGQAVQEAIWSKKPKLKDVLTPVTDDRRCRLPAPHPSHEHRYVLTDGTQGHTYCRGDRTR